MAGKKRQSSRIHILDDGEFVRQSSIFESVQMPPWLDQGNDEFVEAWIVQDCPARQSGFHEPVTGEDTDLSLD